jgi:SAM-dependent methyltransferase
MDTQPKFYDSDYYDRGIETGKSLYTNFRWLPDFTMPLVMSYIDFLGITRDHKVLDYGCGKGGYVVKALRLLYRKAWGCDVSEYAVNSADNDTRQYLRVADEGNVIPFDQTFDFIISKDVFEHLNEEILTRTLLEMTKKGRTLFAIVPLGKSEKYVIPAYELDVTHLLRKDKDWWTSIFEKNGWKVEQFSFYIPGIKESWANFPEGNGFFLLQNSPK